MKSRSHLRATWFSPIILAGIIGPFVAQAWADSAADVVKKISGMSQSERQAFLEAGAKKEGTFILYGTTAVDHSNQILAGFRRRYPFLETKLFRAGSTALLRKILTEAQAGRHEADVFQQAPGPIWEIRNAGLIEPYFSPYRAGVREGMMDDSGHFTALYHIVVVIGYNSEAVEKKDIPESYEDLLRPTWKGRLHMDTQDADWFHTLLEHWGEEKGMAYMKKLAANDPQVRTGHTLAAQLLAAGEFTISPVLYGYRVNQMMAQGAPLDFTLIDPVISKPRGVALAKHAPRPHAGILFIDWILSEEGQTLIGKKLGRSPIRKGVKSKYERLDYDNFVVVNGETFAPMYKKRLEQFHTVFGMN